MTDTASRVPALNLVPLTTWRQMLAPARADIIEAMRALGPCTLRDIAAVLGRSRPSLYPHVERLRTLGVLRELPSRKLTRHVERVYSLTARDFQPDVELADTRSIAKLALTTADGVMKSAHRALRRGAKAGVLRVKDGERNHGIMHELLWLTPRELAELRQQLNGLKQLASTRKKTANRTPYLCVAMYVPLPASSSSDRSRRHG